MQFAPPSVVQSLESSGGQGRYFNISKIEDSKPVRLTILSEEPLWYWEVWGEDSEGGARPFRFSSQPTSEDILTEMGGSYRVREVPEKWAKRPGQKEEPKLTCALAIYNQNNEAVEVMAIKQITIQRELTKIADIEDYSDLNSIDLQISKDSVGDRPVYSVQPLPRKKGTETPLKEAWSAAQEAGFDLTRLISNEDPFKRD